MTNESDHKDGMNGNSYSASPELGVREALLEIAGNLFAEIGFKETSKRFLPKSE